MLPAQRQSLEYRWAYGKINSAVRSFIRCFYFILFPNSKIITHIPYCHSRHRVAPFSRYRVDVGLDEPNLHESENLPKNSDAMFVLNNRKLESHAEILEIKI